MTLPPIDKIIHFLAGFCVAAAVMPFGMVEAAFATFIVAVGKEVRDKYFGGTVELADFVYTVTGGAAFIGWILLLSVLLGVLK